MGACTIWFKCCLYSEVLLILLSLQKFPGDLLPSTYCNPEDVNDIRARSELERRGEYVDILEGEIGFRHPGLVELVKQCLHNAPRERPNTNELLARLQRMKVEVEGEYGGPFRLDMVRVRLAKEVKVKDRRIVELSQQQVYWYGVESLPTSSVSHAGDTGS